MDALNEKGMVSVIVPCYNQAIYLPEALNSLLAQTYQCWEAIVVNDGSPDETEKVALEYTWKDSRIKYVFKENGGLSSARNKGIELAQGEFILPLDADDIIHPEYMEKAMENQIFIAFSIYRIVRSYSSTTIYSSIFRVSLLKFTPTFTNFLPSNV